MVNYRMSEVQKETLISLAKAFMAGIKRPKSTDLNDVINRQLGKIIHPNNFRTSCKTLSERGLIMRTKDDLDWYINITPEGVEHAVKLIQETSKNEQITDHEQV